MSAASPEPFDVPPERRPRHIAVIMDGNGRWARRRGLPRVEGHRAGAQSVRRTVEEAARLGVEQVTLYCLSSENWKRPREELDFLMQLLHAYLIEERERILENDIVVQMIGRREGLTEPVLRELDETISRSQRNTGIRVALAINYGGRGEIADAVRAIAHHVESGRLAAADIGESTIDDHLYTAGLPDPDLLIRTAGEMRISNFLLWQISYAELWVTDRLWPDFDEGDLRQAVRDFASRQRRYGGLLAGEE